MCHYSFLADPTPDDIKWVTALYRQAGWWPDADDDPDLVLRIVAGSHCFVAASLAGEMVGMGRAISDGASDAYIQDVTVDPAFRGKGIGTRIVETLVHRLRRDGLTWIGLIAERNTLKFYEPLGFGEMPDAAPMLLTMP